MWVRISLRLPGDAQKCADSDCDYVFLDELYSSTERVVAFHNTRIESLVEPTKYSWAGAVGNGILRDHRLRYGRCSHGKNIGVNVYGDGGFETFEGCKGWCQFEVEASNITRLRGTRANRYCVRGSSGEICRKVVF